MLKKFSKLSLAILILTVNSCVGQITNNIDAKIDSKIDATANVNTNVDTNVKTGDINTNNSQNNNPLPNNTIQKKALKFSNIQNFMGFEVGQKGKLSIDVIYEDGSVDKDVTYTSNNNNIFTITSDGNFSAISQGKVNIIVISNKDKNFKDVIVINVVIPTPKQPEVTPNPNPTPIITPLPTQTPLPIITPTPLVTPIPTPIPTPSSNISQIKPRITGKIFDQNNSNVPLVTVNLKLNGTIISTYETSDSGYFEFNNLVVGNKYLIEVLKQGWTSSKKEILAELEGMNYQVNFQGDLAIQDEPEIIETKINNTLVTFAGANDNPPKASTVVSAPDLSGNELKIELTFSEAINKSDFTNGGRGLKIQALKVSNGQLYNIDNSFLEASIVYSSDDKKCTIVFPGSFLKTAFGSNQKIICRLESVLKDKTYRESIPEKVFNFGSSKSGFTTFSLLTGN